MADTVEIRLLGFPLQLYVSYREYFTELMREFALIALHVPDADAKPLQHDIPARLVELVDDLRATYANVPQSANEERERAIQDGRTSIDLVYVAPAGLAEDMARLARLLAEADEFCRSDQLLTLETPPQEKAFRDWYVSEVVRQAQGEKPIPWSDIAPQK